MREEEKVLGRSELRETNLEVLVDSLGDGLGGIEEWWSEVIERAEVGLNGGPRQGSIEHA